MKGESKLRKLLSVLLCFSVCFSLAILPVHSEENDSSQKYAENVDFLKAIGALNKNFEYPEKRIPERTEYARLLAGFTNRSDIIGEYNQTEYDTSYLNDEGWLWIDEALSSEANLSDTEFLDVNSTFKDLDCIKNH